MAKVKKAIIPAAGLGTRFLPATKSVPKELLPIVDKPGILLSVEEAVAAGAEEIIIIQGRGKSAIEDFFDKSFELEAHLESKGQLEWLKPILDLRTKANIISIRQQAALGLGHAVLCGRPIVQNNSFLVLLPDELMVGNPNVSAQLAKAFDSSGVSTVAVMEVPIEEVSKYGICDVEKKSETLFKIKGLIEKPSQQEAPSRWMLPGRYLFTPELFEFLATTKKGRGGEIQLTDAMIELAKTGKLDGMTFSARRFDTGDKLGFLKANVELALEHPVIGKDFRQYLKTFVGKL